MKKTYTFIALLLSVLTSKSQTRLSMKPDSYEENSQLHIKLRWKYGKIMRDVSKYIFSLLVFFSCKKYPENKGIHLNKPYNRLNGVYYLTQYTVDGVDSIPYLNQKTNTDVTQYFWDGGESYHDPLFDGPLGNYGYKFSSDKKYLTLTNYSENNNIGPPTVYYNIFMTETSEWRILKLTGKAGKKKPVLKLQRQYNGKTYIFQFN